MDARKLPITRIYCIHVHQKSTNAIDRIGGRCKMTYFTYRRSLLQFGTRASYRAMGQNLKRENTLNADVRVHVFHNSALQLRKIAIDIEKCRWMSLTGTVTGKAKRRYGGRGRSKEDSNCRNISYN